MCFFVKGKMQVEWEYKVLEISAKAMDIVQTSILRDTRIKKFSP